MEEVIGLELEGVLVACCSGRCLVLWGGVDAMCKERMRPATGSQGVV